MVRIAQREAFGRLQKIKEGMLKRMKEVAESIEERYGGLIAASHHRGVAASGVLGVWGLLALSYQLLADLITRNPSLWSHARSNTALFIQGALSALGSYRVREGIKAAILHQGLTHKVGEMVKEIKGMDLGNVERYLKKEGSFDKEQAIKDWAYLRAFTVLMEKREKLCGEHNSMCRRGSGLPKPLGRYVIERVAHSVLLSGLFSGLSYLLLQHSSAPGWLTPLLIAMPFAGILHGAVAGIIEGREAVARLPAFVEEVKEQGEKTLRENEDADESIRATFLRAVEDAKHYLKRYTWEMGAREAVGKGAGSIAGGRLAYLPER